MHKVVDIGTHISTRNAERVEYYWRAVLGLDDRHPLLVLHNFFYFYFYFTFLHTSVTHHP